MNNDAGSSVDDNDAGCVRDTHTPLRMRAGDCDDDDACKPYVSPLLRGGDGEGCDFYVFYVPRFFSFSLDLPPPVQAGRDSIYAGECGDGPLP